MDSSQIVSITWGRTINLGNYESARLDITARVNPDQDWREVLKALKFLVLKEEQRLRNPSKGE